MADEEGLTQRERRAQRYQAEKPKVRLPTDLARKAIVPGFILLLIGAVVTGMVLNQRGVDDCPGHWHGAYTVFVEGERVPFDPSFNPAWGSADNPDAPGTHIHDDDGIYHFHPAAPRCTEWNDALANLGVKVSRDSLELEPAHGRLAGTYSNDGTHRSYVYTRAIDGEWMEASSPTRPLGRQPANGSDLVIIYGEHSQDEIDVLLGQAWTIRGTTYDPTQFQ